MAQESAPLPEQPLKKSTDTVGYPAFFCRELSSFPQLRGSQDFYRTHPCGTNVELVELRLLMECWLPPEVSLRSSCAPLAEVACQEACPGGGS